MQLTPETHDGLSDQIHDWTGIVVGRDKAYLLRHRLEPVIAAHKLGGFDELLSRLKTGGRSKLRDEVVDAITTQETSFFRDPWFFETIASRVVADWEEQRLTTGRARLRMFSAGSSTGQEAYSLAMLVRERIDSAAGDAADAHFSIVAGDICITATERARSGSYTKSEVSRGVSVERLARHFQQRAERWHVVEPVQRFVHFRQMNLLDLPGDLGLFDLVLCRNVLIYFDPQSRERVLRALVDLLHPGAWLGLGSAESVPAGISRLKSIRVGRAVLYQKQST